jgi:hypothetical protein
VALVWEWVCWWCKRRRLNSPISADEHFEDALPNEITPDVQKALKHFPGTVKKGKIS